MKVGFILECSPSGPDADIYPHLARKFCPELEVEKPQTLINKANVMADGPTVAKLLLEAKCDYVFIIWDRMPKWDGSGNCDSHRAIVEAGLDALEIDKSRVILCCIKDMLESWMIADGTVITEFFQSFTTHRLQPFPDYKSEAEQAKPEEKLARYNGKYNKYSHNFEIVKRINDFKKIANRNNSFKHFKEHVERICTEHKNSK